MFLFFHKKTTGRKPMIAILSDMENEVFLGF